MEIIPFEIYKKKFIESFSQCNNYEELAIWFKKHAEGYAKYVKKLKEEIEGGGE